MLSMVMLSLLTQGAAAPEGHADSMAMVERMEHGQRSIDALLARNAHERPPGSPAVAAIAVVGIFSTLMLGLVIGAWVLSRLARRRGSDLRRGLLLIFFGLGLGASEEAHGLWTLALVPLFVGVGYVVASHWVTPSASSRH